MFGDVQSFAIMLTSLFNSGNHNVLDMEIGALCPISEAMISAKDMQCASFPNLHGTVYPYGSY